MKTTFLVLLCAALLLAVLAEWRMVSWDRVLPIIVLIGGILSAMIVIATFRFVSDAFQEIDNLLD